ncbi:MAG: 4a-hydroxytetrahydrobiopterin dehydratase [Alphaproteobacteria bacterium]
MSALQQKIAKTAKAGWKVGARKISKTFLFKDFDVAFSFMKRCHSAIEKLDHHPEWSNTYNKVKVVLTTHDTGGITLKDVELAAAMDKIAALLKAKDK